MEDGKQAREDWSERIGRRSDRTGDGSAVRLPAPAGVQARAGKGLVALTWTPVEGAMGYLVHRSDSREGPWHALDHHGNDVLAVPTPHYADTTGEEGTAYWYAIASVADLDSGPGDLSDPAKGRPGIEGAGGVEGAGVVEVTVHADRNDGTLRRLWHMIGSERLSQLFDPGTTGSTVIGEDFAAAFVMARTELGVDCVRAHAILHDNLGVYREVDGKSVYDFAMVDAVYDQMLSLGIRPIVELGFMPRDLARDPVPTVFTYAAHVSPPKDWNQWVALVTELTRHLVERYGVDEVARWGFEVWNEPNLTVFWSGDQDDYWRLYAVTARAVKAVDPRLLVGGPATAAAGWLEPFLAHVSANALPLDFLSTHTYGNLPLNLRPILARHDLSEVRVWWTEWGVTPQHFNDVTDAPFGAPFVLHGMKAGQATIDQLAYWVVSDQFEELGRPEQLLHGGFGLLTVGNLRKPRYLALQLAEQLSDDLCVVEIDGDGAYSLVDAWASLGADGRVDVLMWNGTLDQSKAAGASVLDRTIELRIDGLSAQHTAELTRVDADHANFAQFVEEAWPDDGAMDELRKQGTLDPQPFPLRYESDGVAVATIALPMPGVVRLQLRPA